jgi:hypothetical protein
MSRGVERAFAEWRFLSLTLLICAYLLAAPLIVGRWQIQILMEVRRFGEARLGRQPDRWVGAATKHRRAAGGAFFVDLDFVLGVLLWLMVPTTSRSA